MLIRKDHISRYLSLNRGLSKRRWAKISKRSSNNVCNERSIYQMLKRRLIVLKRRMSYKLRLNKLQLNCLASKIQNWWELDCLLIYYVYIHEYTILLDHSWHYLLLQSTPSRWVERMRTYKIYVSLALIYHEMNVRISFQGCPNALNHESLCNWLPFILDPPCTRYPPLMIHLLASKLQPT